MFLFFIKETNIFLSSDKKNEPPNPNSSHIMYIGFEYVMPSPRNYFKVLYYTVKISDA